MSAATEVTDAKAPSAALEAGLAMLALFVASLVGYGWFLGFHVDNAHNGLIAASFSAVGLYVVRMRPRHREGWLFVAVGVVHAVMFFGRQYGRAEGVLPAASWIGWLGVWPLPLAIGVAVRLGSDRRAAALQHELALPGAVEDVNAAAFVVGSEGGCSWKMLVVARSCCPLRPGPSGRRCGPVTSRARPTGP